MTKALTAITLMVAGAAAIAGVVYLQTNRYALTHFDPATHEVADQEFAPAPPPVANDAPTVAIVDLPTRLIAPIAPTAPTALSVRAVHEPAVPVPVALVPCTEWRDLGPVSLSVSEPPRQRRVQMLCPKGTTPPAPDPPG